MLDRRGPDPPDGTDGARGRRAAVLRGFGAHGAVLDELLAYNDNPYARMAPPRLEDLPPAPEPYLQAWKAYALEAEWSGAWDVLSRRLPQLSFPIREGISGTDDYRAATLRGSPVAGLSLASGLTLERPNELRLQIHQGIAGPAPVLIPAGRSDFVTFVRALAMRNEPREVPDSQGAATVKGFNNWDRVRVYRPRWEAEHPGIGEAGWTAEFQRLIPRREQYQDHFIILSDGPYSDVAAADASLSDEAWKVASLAIRAEHEYTHTLTLRLFGTTRNNALDELLCDYAGIVAAAGHLRAGWLDRFLGLEAFPRYRDGGRLQNYLGSPPLSDGAFRVLQALVHAAACNLERFDATVFSAAAGTMARAPSLIGMLRLSLEDLAFGGVVQQLAAAEPGCWQYLPAGA